MLTDLDRQMLDFAAQQWRYLGAQEQAIREQFDCSATRYWQRVNTLIEEPEALAYAPMTVNRLRRLKDRQQVIRAVRRRAS